MDYTLIGLHSLILHLGQAYCIPNTFKENEEADPENHTKISTSIIKWQTAMSVKGMVYEIHTFHPYVMSLVTYEGEKFT